MLRKFYEYYEGKKIPKREKMMKNKIKNERGKVLSRNNIVIYYKS